MRAAEAGGQALAAANASSSCKLMAKNIPQEIPIKALRAHFAKCVPSSGCLPLCD
jgi:hypothetical protein